MFLYSRAMQTHASHVNARLILSGIAFGAATLVRSNGLLSGVIFAVDFFSLQLNMIGRPPTLEDSRLLLSKGFAGLAIGIGFLLPQIVAYREYCFGPKPRLWCSRLFPSIYSWVQEHYWYVWLSCCSGQSADTLSRNVGLFRYWTISNIPLFVLAVPALTIMLATASSVHLSQFSYLSRRLSMARRGARPKQPKKKPLQRYANSTIRRLAIPQAILAVLAFTSFHVQIITRLSSAYPIWYFMLARAIVERRKWFGWLTPEHVIRWMVVYALVQGALFTSFLPPA